MPSAQGASVWKYGPIDVLFIDAGHTFMDVYTDFSLWVNHLKPGGLVLFHDYDPLERGSVVHLGVRLFCDTLIRNGCLHNIVHKGRILTGNINDVETALPAPEAFAETWKLWGEKIRKIRSAYQPNLIGDPSSRKVHFIQKLLNAKLFSKLLVKSHSLTLCMERPFSDQALEMACDGKCELELLDDWSICYLIQDALMHNRDLLLDCMADRSILFKFNELIEMLLHTTDSDYSGNIIFSEPEVDLHLLSRRCAKELLRLHFLDILSNNFKTPH
jgi:hypothetical protein